MLIKCSNNIWVFLQEQLQCCVGNLNNSNQKVIKIHILLFSNFNNNDVKADAGN